MDRLALGEVQRRAKTLGLGDIAGHAGRGIAHDRELIDQLMRCEAGSPDSFYGADAPSQARSDPSWGDPAAIVLATRLVLTRLCLLAR